MNRKLAASVLAGLSALTVLPSIMSPVASAVTTTISSSQREIKNQNINFEITKEQAIEDINYVLKIIKDKHVSAVEKVTDEVMNQAKSEIKNLKDRVSVIEEWRIISRILVKLKDAHTRVLSPKFLNKRLPFDTEYKDGKFICTSGEFRGYTVTAINDISVQELYKIFKNHFSHEIEEWTEHNFFEAPSDFIPEWRLALCGIDTSKPIKVSFEAGTEIKEHYFDMSKIKTPNASSENWISYEIDEKNSIGIFKLNRCVINDEYSRTILLKFFKEISDKKIKNIAVDLRKNPGGYTPSIAIFVVMLKNLSMLRFMNSELRNGEILLKDDGHVSMDEIEKTRVELLGENYDKNILFDGNVFLLTSHQTFSAAMCFAEIFQDNHLGTVVGEVPGNSCEFFGGVVQSKFETPNSKLIFKTTRQKLYRIDSTKDPDRLVPDVQVSAKDALNKVYELIKSES